VVTRSAGYGSSSTCNRIFPSIVNRNPLVLSFDDTMKTHRYLIHLSFESRPIYFVFHHSQPLGKRRISRFISVCPNAHSTRHSNRHDIGVGSFGGANSFLSSALELSLEKRRETKEKIVDWEAPTRPCKATFDSYPAQHYAAALRARDNTLLYADALLDLNGGRSIRVRQ